MITTREEHLVFCDICTHRKFNSQKGLLCGLTDEFAAFEKTCPDFIVDEKRQDKNLKFDIKNAGHDNASSSLDFEKNKQNGLAISVVGLVLLVIWFLYFGGLITLLLAASVLIYGIRTYTRGQAQEKVLAKRKEFDEAHLKK